MAKVDAPYVIAVIRSEEKKLLQDDEFTRIISAPTKSEAVRALSETVYGQWTVDKQDDREILEAINRRLDQALSWLRDEVNDEATLSIIEAKAEVLKKNLDGEKWLASLERNASGKLAGWYASHWRERLEAEQKERTPETEQSWDVQVIDKLKEFKTDPIGNDAILAFWLALELEVKSLRRVLAAKLAGFEEEKIRELMLPLYV